MPCGAASRWRARPTAARCVLFTAGGSDFLGILLHLRGTFCLSAAYNEALVLMDDPFAGFSNEEVDELFEAGAPDIFSSRLFAARSLVVTFGGSAPQRALRRGRQGRPRFLVMEAGNLQALEPVEAPMTGPETQLPALHSTATSGAVELQQGQRLAAASPSWLLVLCLDQFFQILLDWWVISLALTSLTPLTPLTLHLTGAFFVAAVAAGLEVHLSLKLLVVHLGARSYTEAAAKMAFDIDTTTVPTVTAQAEREMDLQLPGQLWGLLAGSCAFFGLLGLSQLQLSQSLASPWQLSLVPIYVLALKALAAGGGSGRSAPLPPLLDTLRRELQMGVATQARQ
ncbi:unnamed protein product [Cladocopium goreaui]|uniref:Uncharacterized protein n=1 Tax=Cladocopium goreaui TaxID=2562237 RepID=A0A9P1GG56_9DINO|nr:unnamed protein product [Cladocopium goreaui]